MEFQHAEVDIPVRKEWPTATGTFRSAWKKIETIRVPRKACRSIALFSGSITMDYRRWSLVN